MALYLVRVAIFGDDRVVGGALEVLLRGAGYDAWFQADPTPHQAESLITGANLVIFSPATYAEGCKILTGAIASHLRTEVPVLRLVTGTVDEGCETRSVTWPCSIRFLEREIEAALLASPRD